MEVGAPSGDGANGGSASFLPVFTRSYLNSSMKAYNISRFVVERLSLDDVVFFTSMCYWHEFACLRGHKKIDEVVLAASCVFLAAKVEHYKVRVDQVVSIVFECTGEEASGWRQMLLEVELVLCDTLHFNFQRDNPNGRMLLLLDTPPATGEQEDGQRSRRLKEVAARILVISLVAPLFTKVSAEEVGRVVAYLTTTYSGCSGAYAHLWEQNPLPTDDVKQGIVEVILDTFELMHKQTGLKALDDQIAERRKRRRSTPRVE